MTRIKWLFLFFTCIIIAISYAIFVVVSSSKLEQQIITDDLEPKMYRFVCLYSGENEYFIETLQEGIAEATDDLNVWVSFYSFNSNELQDHSAAFEKAIASNVDGIITNVPDLPTIGLLIDRAGVEKIPVITIVNDFYGSQRKTFIGVDYYSFGQMAAEYLCDITGKTARTVTISSKNYENNYEYRQKVSGYRDSIARYPNMSLGCEYMEQADYLNAYSAVVSALSTQIGYDSFFCLDGMTTLAVARCLKNSGASSVYAVGCGESEEIFEYIDQGILDAVFIEDPYYVGYTAISYMVKHKNGEDIPNTVNTEIKVITKQNLDDIYHPQG